MHHLEMHSAPRRNLLRKEPKFQLVLDRNGLQSLVLRATLKSKQVMPTKVCFLYHSVLLKDGLRDVHKKGEGASKEFLCLMQPKSCCYTLLDVCVLSHTFKWGEQRGCLILNLSKLPSEWRTQQSDKLRTRQGSCFWGEMTNSSLRAWPSLKYSEYFN